MKRILIMTLLSLGLMNVLNSCTKEEVEMIMPPEVDDSSNSGNDVGSSGEAAEEFSKLINENVKCSASFSDYFWNVKIESKLGSSVSFNIGHGTSYDTNCTVVTSNDENATKTTSTQGNTTITTIREPFYFYFIYRNSYEDSNYLAESRMYLSSFEALKKKESSGITLSSEEVNLRNELMKALNKNLSLTQSYAIYVFARSGNQTARIGMYRR